MTGLGIRLYELRKMKGLSQEELAEKLFVSRQAVSKWERDEAYPDTDNLIALADLYGISLDELVRGKPHASSAELSEGEATNSENVGNTASGNPLRDSADGEKEEKRDTSGDGAEDDDDESNDGDEPKGGVLGFLRAFPYPILATVVFLLWGFLIEGGFAVSWTVFLTVPIYYSIIDMIQKYRLSEFCYPALATFIYLYVGMSYGLWHPSWLIFVTIPIFYAITETIDRSVKRAREMPDEESADAPDSPNEK